MSGTYRIAFLGCKANQCDADAHARALESAGLRRAQDGKSADVCLVQTCAVTATAAAKSRQALRRLAARNPGARLVAAGCLVDAGDDTCGALAIPNAARGTLLERLGLRENGPPAGTGLFAGRGRAFLKVEDGCDARCAYCIVPHLRGPVASLPPARVREESARLAREGFGEIVLTGVHLGAYGRDRENAFELADAVEAALEGAPDARVRVSSVEPGEVTECVAGLVTSHPRVCPHLALPLQSGSSRVLARMRRRYTAGDFLAEVARLRARAPELALTTDVLVGFPGETEEDFAETLRVVREVAFSRVHAFPFSPRPGTEAFDARPRVPERVAGERRRRVAEEGARLAAEYARRFVGREVEVVVERSDGASGLGRSEHYLVTHLAGRVPPPGTRLAVRVARAELDALVAEPLETDA